MEILKKILVYLPPKLVLSTIFFTSLYLIFMPGALADFFSRVFGIFLLVALIHVIFNMIFKLIRKNNQKPNGNHDE
ncbi:hypothetical protein [Pseudoalteromonas aurantia]|uniref:Uncharacterized protein n=1 Tax=Pseudoalteromonas aurantia 208 TaxID=1314867 RepID=A0ABR9E7L1_9GAMM|nr:hypothetical protein [Pseudoalteromonas aurantia]MBE0366936.1 hypothetical protein [Pseudoalteromonas aurantia 208]